MVRTAFVFHTTLESCITHSTALHPLTMKFMDHYIKGGVINVIIYVDVCLLRAYCQIYKMVKPHAGIRSELRASMFNVAASFSWPFPSC